jgi:hypothetical protein
MQNVARKPNATVATALLFISLLMLPLSLKAIGISPNLSAGVAVWRHIAGIFADSYQPVNAWEMLAVNFTDEGAPRDEAEPGTGELLASAQPLEVQLNDATATSADARGAENSAAAAPAARRCTKSVRPAPRATLSTPATSVVISVEDVRAQALEAAESAKALVPIRGEVVRGFEREMANYRVTLGEAMRIAPRDFKLMLKVKSPAPPKLPALGTCAWRKQLSPEQVKQLRTAWSFTTVPVAQSADKSEL